MLDIRFDDPIEARLADALTAMRADLIAFCQRLIQTPSVNGVDDEIHVANLIADEARRLGLPIQIVGEQPHRPNVIVSTADEGETGLLLLGHLDTVPPGDVARWTQPPFSGALVDGRIYGRGAIDTKGGMAAALYALAALKQHPDALPHGRAQFIGVPDEETGATGTLGIKYLFARDLLSGAGAIYAYSGSEIILGHRGVLRYRVTCTGESVHTGAAAWQERTSGANAVMGMARLLTALDALRFPRSSAPYFGDYRTVITPGTLISGGVSVNIVPDRCEAWIDVRTTPENDTPTLEAMFDGAIAEIERAHPPLTFAYERINHIPAVCSDENAPIFSVLADVIPLVRGGTVAKTVAGPANEGYLLIERGIPTACGLGPTGANAHAADEYADAESLVEAALIFSLTARRLSLR
ncbi:MAG: M20/M25/M40 family metallo-hydrolase [Chloroflexota bacterium]|nr:M20/M25/M40 family metallo-hydrolase [Chloroflexota bacterium]